MKKGFKFILMLLIIFGILFGIKYIYGTIKENKRLEDIKKGWYVEIITDKIKVRDDHDEYSYNKGGLIVKKGEIYKAIEFYVGKYYWFKIEFKDGTTGWIANTKSGSYLIDHNNPIDIATPVIKYYNEIYYVDSIDKINYDHLKCWDDRDDYKVSHEVYHEVDEMENIDQYWIKYTITDASGKSSSKTQKIVFRIRPKESNVKDFAEWTN